MRGTHPIQSLRYRLRLRDADLRRRRMKRHLPDDPVIVEAGAHIGEDTTELARMWPRGRIHAFEPIPGAFRQLEAAVSGIANAETHQLALGTTEGTTSMWLDERLPNYSSMLAPADCLEVWPWLEFEEVEVRVTTLTAWAEGAGVDRVDGMWLDMQGGELHMLKAAGPVFETVRALTLEISSTELYAGAPLWPEAKLWLEQHGFQVVSERWAHPTYGDAVLVRRG